MKNEKKEILIDLIKDAKYSKTEDLEAIPGTDIKIKKEMHDFFKVAALEYYIKDLNKSLLGIKLEDVFQEVYNSVEKELLVEDEEYLISNAYDMFNENKKEIEEAKALIKELEQITTNLEMNQKLMQEAMNDKKVSAITNISDSTAKLVTRENEISRRLNEIRTVVNNGVLEKIDKEIKFIEDNLEHTFSGTSTVYDKTNGKKILKYDEKEYKSLLALRDIMSRINDNDYEKFMTIDDLIIAPENKQNRIKQLMQNINIFKYDHKKTKNEDMIKLVEEEINRLVANAKAVNEGKVFARDEITLIKLSDRDEFDRLNAILNYLKKGEEYENSINIWGIGHILPEDREEFLNLVRKTAFFNEYNQDKKLKEENEKTISELEKYLNSLVEKCKELEKISRTNVKTRKIAKDVVVLENDFEEYMNIVQIIDILSRQSEDLTNVWGVGNINRADIEEFKKYVNNTTYFQNKIVRNSEELAQEDKSRGAEVDEPTKGDAPAKEDGNNVPEPLKTELNTSEKTMPEEQKNTLEQEGDKSRSPEAHAPTKEDSNNVPETKKEETPSLREALNETKENIWEMSRKINSVKRPNYVMRKFDPEEYENFKQEIHTIKSKGLARANVALGTGAIIALACGSVPLTIGLSVANLSAFGIKKFIEKKKNRITSDIQRSLLAKIENQEITEYEQYESIVENCEKRVVDLKNKIEKLEANLDEKNRSESKEYNALLSELYIAEYTLAENKKVAKTINQRIKETAERINKAKEKREKSIEKEETASMLRKAFEKLKTEISDVASKDNDKKEGLFDSLKEWYSKTKDQEVMDAIIEEETPESLQEEPAIVLPEVETEAQEVAETIIEEPVKEQPDVNIEPQKDLEEEKTSEKVPRIRIPAIYSESEKSQQILHDVLEYFTTKDHNIKNKILAELGIGIDKYLAYGRVQDAINDVAAQLALSEEELLNSLEERLDKLYEATTTSEYAELNAQLYSEDIRILENRINELKGRGR